MSITLGPKLGLLYNAFINEFYADNFRPFLQAIDALVFANVINSTTIVPPISPNAGDAYLLVSTPSGAWAGHQNAIAVWDTQVTNSGTNTTVPQWVFYSPNPGWLVWNVATASYYSWSGTAWSAFAAGANFPVNTNITSMTGLTNQTINSSGYAYNDGTDPATAIGAKWSYGSPTFGTGTGIVVANQAWTGTSVTDIGVGVFGDSGQFSLVSPTMVTGSGTCEFNTVISLGTLTGGSLQVGSGAAGNTGQIAPRGSTNVGLQLSGAGITTLQSAVLINSGTGVSPISGVGLLGFGSNYATQTTVGAAGGASALPATPTGYLQIAVNGTVYVIPYYAHV